MNTRTTWFLTVALACLPAAALAQHGHAIKRYSAPAAPAVASPAQAAAAEVPSPKPAMGSHPALPPDDSFGDADLLDSFDVLAFDLGDEFYVDPGDDEGDAPEPAMGSRRELPPDLEDMQGPDGPHGMGQPHMGGGGMPGNPGMMRRRGMGGGRSMRHLRMALVMRLKLSQLDLTDAQRGRFRDLHEAHARKAVQRRADMQLARMDLHRLMRADRPDAPAVNAQIDKLARLRADGLKSAFDMRLQARAVFTPEQLRKLREPVQPMMMRHEMMDTPDGRRNR